MERILNNSDLNDFKISIAILRNQNSSRELLEDKLFLIADLLQLEPLEIEPVDGDEEVPENVWHFMVPDAEIFWVQDMWRILASDCWEEFRIEILGELLRIEAYLEIIELGLDKIKIND